MCKLVWMQYVFAQYCLDFVCLFVMNIFIKNNKYRNQKTQEMSQGNSITNYNCSLFAVNYVKIENHSKPSQQVPLKQEKQSRSVRYSIKSHKSSNHQKTGSVHQDQTKINNRNSKQENEIAQNSIFNQKQSMLALKHTIQKQYKQGSNNKHKIKQQKQRISLSSSFSKMDQNSSNLHNYSQDQKQSKNKLSGTSLHRNSQHQGIQKKSKMLVHKPHPTGSTKHKNSSFENSRHQYHRSSYQQLKQNIPSRSSEDEQKIIPRNVPQKLHTFFHYSEENWSQNEKESTPKQKFCIHDNKESKLKKVNRLNLNKPCFQPIQREVTDRIAAMSIKNSNNSSQSTKKHVSINLDESSKFLYNNNVVQNIEIAAPQKNNRHTRKKSLKQLKKNQNQKNSILETVLVQPAQLQSYEDISQIKIKKLTNKSQFTQQNIIFNQIQKQQQSHTQNDRKFQLQSKYKLKSNAYVNDSYKNMYKIMNSSNPDHPINVKQCETVINRSVFLHENTNMISDDSSDQVTNFNDAKTLNQLTHKYVNSEGQGSSSNHISILQDPLSSIQFSMKKSDVKSDNNFDTRAQVLKKMQKFGLNTTADNWTLTLKKNYDSVSEHCFKK